jgi:hypothetical protein
MTCFPLGRVNVPTPGTPVPLAAGNLYANRIYVQVIPGLTSKFYIGVAGMDKSTMAGVIRILYPNAAGGISDFWEITSFVPSDPLRLADYFLDCDVATEGVLATYW